MAVFNAKITNLLDLKTSARTEEDEVQLLRDCLGLSTEKFRLAGYFYVSQAGLALYNGYVCIRVFKQSMVFGPLAISTTKRFFF